MVPSTAVGNTGQSTIWNKIDALIASAPPDAWKDVPTDLSHNHDHYLYGSPKR